VEFTVYRAPTALKLTCKSPRNDRKHSTTALANRTADVTAASVKSFRFIPRTPIPAFYPTTVTDASTITLTHPSAI
jgi:hypothetical protein